MSTCPTCAARHADDASTCPADGATLVPDDVELEPGAMVGEYRIERKLGEGGFGSVFRVVHPLIGKTAALKVLSAEFSSNPEMVSRFVAEARAVNQIRHKGIVDIFAFGVLPSGRQYFVMELLEGLAFDRYLARAGAIAPDEALPLLFGIARALDAAHAAQVLHRDLKPENVYLVQDEDGYTHTKLLDFGIAKVSSESPGHRTRTGMPMGTPRYMSPEQCRGMAVDHRTDVYSFGVMCFQVLTGRLPFDSAVVMDLLFQHTNAPPPLPSSINPQLPSAFDAPILRMLAKSPDARPVSAGAALEELFVAAEQAGLTVSAAPPRLRTPPLAVEEDGRGFDALADTTPSTPKEPHALPMLAGSRTPRPAEPFRPSTPSPRRTNPSQAPSPLPAQPKSSRLPLVLGAVGLLIAGAAAGILISGSHEPEGPVAAVTPTAAVRGELPTNPINGPNEPEKSEPVASPSVPAAPAAPPAEPVAEPGPTPSAPTAEPVATDARPDQVTVTVRCAVATAAVYQGSRRLGNVGQPLSLPFGQKKISLTVKAAGYHPVSIGVVPSSNRTMSATLKPVAVNKELEDPFKEQE